MTVASPIDSVADQQHIVLHDVSWELYEHLLDEVGDRPIRMTFDNGDLEIMSPLPRHEIWKKQVARLIEVLAIALRFPMRTWGSTTFRSGEIQKGLEPDECYYIQNAAVMQGRDQWDPAVDPPPDLAVEADITRRSIPRQPIYAALGVPEIWRYIDSRLQVLHLGSDGKYHTATQSQAFPFLPMDKFESFLLRMQSEDETTVVCEFLDWARTLKR